MSDTTTYPDWDNYPCLDNVITKDDVSTKGGGKFAADYVNHMKTSQLLRLHARGWDFELKTFIDADGIENDCWRAPDGTAYVKGFFRAPAGSGFMDTPAMSQAVMDNRNNPIPWEQVSSRDVTDTERRCMCTAAARHFGLAWQLWAKVAIEDPMDESTRPAKAPAKAKAAAPKADTPAQPEKKPASSPVADLQPQVEKELRPLFTEACSYEPEALNKWRTEFRLAFDGLVKNETPTAADIQTQAQFDFTKTWLELCIANAKKKAS